MTIFTDAPNRPVILTVPGLGGSGPTHWQTLWKQDIPDTHRAELGMWDKPERNAWVTRLNQSICDARAPVVLAAHSLGCLAVAWWAMGAPRPFCGPVAGALLVAPPDVDRSGAHPDLLSFRPSPRHPLPFPSIVVASSDDPWIEIERARDLASQWGSHFVDAGPKGHLNAASDIGGWAAGRALLNGVLDAAADNSGKPRTVADARRVLAIEPAERDRLR